MENQNYTLDELVSKMDDEVGRIGLRVESLEHLRIVLSRVAVRANEMIADGRQQYFLWDNNDQIQVLNDLMFLVMEELKKSHGNAHEMQEALHHQVVRGNNSEQQKSPTSGKTLNS